MCTDPAVVYALTALLSGAMIGLAVGFVGGVVSLSPAARSVTAIVGLCVFSAREIDWIRFPVPQLKLRVPRHIVSGSERLAAFIWGAVLGAGFLTFVKFTVFWAMHLVVFTTGSARVGVLVGALYGFSRALPTMLLSMSPRLRETRCLSSSGAIYSQATFVARIGAAVMMVGAILLARVFFLSL